MSTTGGPGHASGEVDGEELDNGERGNGLVQAMDDVRPALPYERGRAVHTRSVQPCIPAV